LAEIAAPHLDALCQKASWPSDLVVLNSKNLHMELKESSRASTPFLLNRDAIGHRINLPLSAVGRVYLAFCEDDEKK
jgi:IclR family mhp operon transcriptional activator